MRKKTTSFARLATRFIALLLVLLSCNASHEVWAQVPSTQERAILRPGLSDTRIAVLNTSMYPFSTIARIVSTFPNGEQSVGTGAFVGPNRVVTAGHNIYDRGAGGYARRVLVTPGYNNGSAPFGATYSTYVVAPTSYTRQNDPNFDFGLITTALALGWNTGWLGMKATDNNDLNAVLLCGYPNDLGRTELMYFAGGQSRWESPFRLEYLFWTDSGMSGGPLINNYFYVVGIHTGGNDNYNYGISINRELLSWFR